MYKCSFKLDVNMQKELNKRIWVLGLLCTILGGFYLAVYAVLVAFDLGHLIESFVFISVVLLVLGIFYIFLVNKTNSAYNKKNFFEELVLNEDHLIERVSKDGEVVATNKFYYKDLLKIKETKSYLFLYVNAAAAVPILKTAFSEEDFAKIRTIINNARYKTETPTTDTEIGKINNK